MILNTLTAPFRFWRHLKYHREIIKHLRWSMADAQRIEFYKTLVRPSDLVFDVGANMGNRSKIFRAIGAKVIAFEPQSYCARFLTVAFSGDPDFILVQSALSDAEGEQTMHLSNAHVLSTLDTQWLNRISHGGRFSDQKWDRTEVVQVTTLDKSIQNFGVPDFIKIDVEGHEFNVLKGLTFPVNLLSLEFASESLDNIFKCIDHLDTLAQYDYRISLGESMKFEGSTWSDGPEIKALLAESMKHDPLVWGDIYAKCIR
jgi:FkbM family methyltransferase